jgi:hypothetical protein
MSWILEHLNLVIVGVLVLGSFLKSRLDALNRDDEEPENLPEYEVLEDHRRQAPPSIPYVPPPLERTPPPIVIQRSVEPPRVFAATRSQSGAMTASADEAASILQKQRDIQERLRVIREAHPAKTDLKSPSRPMMTVRKRTPVVSGSTPSSLRARLRNPAELRRAIVLREILDRPVGLR